MRSQPFRRILWDGVTPPTGTTSGCKPPVGAPSPASWFVSAAKAPSARDSEAGFTVPPKKPGTPPKDVAWRRCSAPELKTPPPGQRGSFGGGGARGRLSTVHVPTGPYKLSVG